MLIADGFIINGGGGVFLFDLVTAVENENSNLASQRKNKR